MEHTQESEKRGERTRCVGNCFQEAEGTQKRCEAYGHHEWCENYMVRKELGIPEFYEEKR